MLFSDLFLVNKGVLHAYHGIVLSAEGYDIKSELLLIPTHQSILKCYGESKDNREQCYGGEEMLVGTILRKSAGDKEEKLKACIINFPVQY